MRINVTDCSFASFEHVEQICSGTNAMNHRLKCSCVALFTLIATSIAWEGSVAQDKGVAHGMSLVKLNCASCHAIGETDKSTHPEAPAFRTLSDCYPLDALEEAFAEGIVTGHPDMPEFVATPVQIADIIAFIETLNPDDSTPRTDQTRCFRQ